MQTDTAADSSAQRRTRKWMQFLPILYLLAVTAICYNTVLLPSRTFLPADIVLLTPPWAQHSHEIAPDFHAAARMATDPLYQFYPARKYLAESLRQGTIPLWNPHIFCGMPFAGDGQSAVFYPINWLFAILPLSMAFGWIAALHTFLAGFFFYIYGRRTGWGEVASLTGATVWMLCGVMVAWQMWQVVDAALCWLPLCLYWWERWRQKHCPARLVAMAVSLAMSLLAGHFQFACYVWMTVFAYALFRGPIPYETLPEDQRADAYRRERWSGLATLVAVFALASGLGMAQIMATLDLLLHSPRVHESLPALLTTAMPLPGLIVSLIPGLFGGVKGGMDTAYAYPGTNYWEITCYFGASALALAAFGCRLREKGHLSLFWFALALFGLLMAVGSPMFTLFYYAVPVFRSFHGLVRIMVLVDFAVAALAAMGVQRLVDDIDLRAKVRPLHVFGALAVLILIGVRFAVTSTPSALAVYSTAYPHQPIPIGARLTHDFVENGYLPTQLLTGLALIAAICLLVQFRRRWSGWAVLTVLAIDMLVFAAGINVGAQSNMLYPSTPDTAYLASHPMGRVLTIGDGNPNHYFSKMIPNTAMSIGLDDVSGSDPLILKSYEDFLKAANREASGSDWPEGQDMAVLPSPKALRAMGVGTIISPKAITVAGFSPVSMTDVYVYQITGPGFIPLPPRLSPYSNGLRACNECYTVDQAAQNTHIVADAGWHLYDLESKKPLAAIVSGPFIGFEGANAGAVFEYLPTPILLGLYLALFSVATLGCMLGYRFGGRKTKQPSI